MFNREITWAVSPKLSISGESWDDAIIPNALLSYCQWPHSHLFLKFVVRDERDIEEVQAAVALYKKKFVTIDGIYLMPEAGTADGLSLTETKVAELCLEYGYNFSPRLQIHLFGNKWGT